VRHFMRHHMLLGRCFVSGRVRVWGKGRAKLCLSAHFLSFY
jgi:hypothetical protein